MKIFYIIGLTVVCLLNTTSSLTAKTIRVPEDCPRIQTAINHAIDGDTVLVAQGTYRGFRNKNLDFLGKDIVVTSSHGPEFTVIDCELDGRGFNFHSGENFSSILSGFKIINGYVLNDGGGIYCRYSSPLIDYCIIAGNQNAGILGNGGGIYCNGASSPIFVECEITNNTAYNNGGGIYADQSASPSFSRCTIQENKALCDGGGVFLKQCSSNFVGCIINNNLALWDGGGIYCSVETDLLMDKCLIKGNRSGSSGGGLFLESGASEIYSCIISENSTVEYGGGAHFELSSSILINCTVYKNNAQRGGGVSFYHDSNAKIKYCTFTENNASYIGGGCYTGWNSVVNVVDCILWNDTPSEIYKDGKVDVSYSDVKGGWTGQGNINMDPLFENPTQYNFHLSEISPCIDMGIDTGIYCDADEDLRPSGVYFDMGSDEFLVNSPSIWLEPQEFNIFNLLGETATDDTLKIYSTGIKDLKYTIYPPCSPWIKIVGDMQGTLPTGESCELILKYNHQGLNKGVYRDTITVVSNDPLRGNIMIPVLLQIFTHGKIQVPGEIICIQDAIDAAGDGDTISVAHGVYRGISNKNLDFQGKAIVLLSETGPDNTIIDCENSGRGFYFHSREDSAAKIIGFTICNGNMDYGGGIYSDSSSCPVFEDCIILSNYALYSGGGIYCRNSSPLIRGCVFMHNQAYWRGGGGACFYNFSATIIDCSFSLNNSNTGGAIDCYYSPCNFIKCIFQDNTSREYGGAVNVYGKGKTVFDSCIFKRNKTTSTSGLGGGVYCRDDETNFLNCNFIFNYSRHGGGAGFDGSRSLFYNCTFSQNSSLLSGGACYNAYSRFVNMTNCIFYNDLPDEIYDSWKGSTILTYSDIQGGWTGIGNIDADPLFSAPELEDFHLLDDSPCIDKGMDVTWIQFDIDYEHRPNGLGYDIGSDEVLYDKQKILLCPRDFSVLNVLGEPVENDTLIILNSGKSGDLMYTVLPGAEQWLALEGNLKGTIIPGDSAFIHLKFTSAGLNKGAHKDTIKVESNDLKNPVIPVPVILQIYSHGCINVPGEITTIQQAINASDDGDTILIADGTYSGDSNKNMDFLGKAITVKSENGPDYSVIECENNGRGFIFHSGEDRTSKLIGLKITNGYSVDDGGGLYFENESSPELHECIITGCTAKWNGGGIFCDNSSPFFIECFIRNNKCFNYGGGAYFNKSSPDFYLCSFLSNNSSWSGGGIYFYYSPATLTNCTISSNAAQRWGGGVHVYNSTLSPATVFTNCNIIFNDCVYNGGGVYIYYGVCSFLHCTIANNYSPEKGGGIFNDSSYNRLTITDCILWYNSITELYAQGSAAIVTYTDIKGGWAGQGNINLDPGFVDPVGDFHLLENSPCIDKGINVGVNIDIDEQSRPQGQGYDIGSDEYPINYFPDI